MYRDMLYHATLGFHPFQRKKKPRKGEMKWKKSLVTQAHAFEMQYYQIVTRRVSRTKNLQFTRRRSINCIRSPVRIAQCQVRTLFWGIRSHRKLDREFFSVQYSLSHTRTLAYIQFRIQLHYYYYVLFVTRSVPPPTIENFSPSL